MIFLQEKDIYKNINEPLEWHVERNAETEMKAAKPIMCDLKWL